MNDPIRVGRLIFKPADIVTRKRGARTIERQRYQCPLCALKVLEDGIQRHLEVHDAREDKKRSAQAARELGMGAKVLPGQLGFEMFGVREKK